ncbi:hypothetical protein NQZ68_040288 [Dissostichus eleginoides]|nr:hypothetical protein NQZ68_040288 [Dissostichus eleginoides]
MPAMDPVQKAVLHHTLGLPPTAKRRHVSCSVCQLRFNSQVSHCSCHKYTQKTPQPHYNLPALVSVLMTFT